MKATSLLTIAGLSWLVAVASCRLAPVTAPTPGMAADQPVAHQVGSGSLRVTVRWPNRRVQFIPSNAESLVVSVYAGSSTTPLATRTLKRTSDIATATMTRLPSGPARVMAQAKDASGVTVALAETPLTLRPNAVSDARLSLQPAESLAITRIEPTNGIPGDGCHIWVDGTGFSYEDQASYSFTIGDPPTPISYAQRIYPYRFALIVPRGVKTGPVRIRMGPYSAVSSQSFIEIGSVSISPTSVTVAPSGTYSFQVQAYDVSGQPVSNPNVRWFMEYQRCIGNICEDGDAAKVNNGLVTGEFDVGNYNVATGRYTDPPGTEVGWGHVVVGNSYVRASASIKIIIP